MEKENELLNHSFYLNMIKRLLKASYVGWELEGNKKTLKVNIQGKSFPMQLSDGDITENTYRDLINQLLEPNGKEL